MTLFLDSLLAPLFAWSAQIFLLVTVAAFAAMTISHAKARLLFWQGILLLTILIPGVEPWKPTPIGVDSISISTQPLSAAARAGVLPAASFRWQRQDWLLLIAVGMALRLLWIAGGFFRLRSYRKSARLLASPPLPFVSGAANWYESDNVPGPVTYGWLRPSILLPARVLALPPALREPIACHELIHVNRRDWLFVLGEEFVRSALWFHPAIWFVLGRIQLAREQVVDREVVSLTENRENYLDALVAVAEQSRLSDLAPAPLFLRKRQLAERVKEVLKEIPMSKSKIAANLAGACSVTFLAGLAAMSMFPFLSPAQTVNDDPGISVNAGAPLIHRAPVRTPATAMTGTVVVEATLNSKGEVTDARVLSGPVELRRTAIESVLQWHYAPGASVAQAIINFEPTTATAVAPNVRAAVGKGAGPAPAFAPPPPPPPPPPPSAQAAAPASAIPAFPATVKSIAFDGIGPEAAAQLGARIPIREGSTMSQADIQSVNQAVQDFDSHLTVAFLFTGTDANGRSMGLNVQSNSAGRQIMLPPAFSLGAHPEVMIRVQAQSAQGQFISMPLPQAQGATDANLTPLKKVTPVYPTLAKSARIQGTVNFNANIAPDGTVSQLTLVNGHPLLVEAARTAVMQWVYAPSGAAAQTQISINFTLQE